MNEKIMIVTVLSILGGISRGTYRRLINENNLPIPETIGRKQYQITIDLYKWLSNLAHRKINIGDKLLSSKQLEELFDRSPTWVWQHFQRNKEWKARAVYIRSRPYWVLSEIYADSELRKYIEIAKGGVEA